MVSFRADMAVGCLNRNLSFNPNRRAGLRLSVGTRLSSWWFCALLNCLGCAGFAADTNAVLAAWFAAQTNLYTWSADFTQTRTLKTLTQPLVASGHIWFAAPNRFRWELGVPAKTIALRNADDMFVIYPRLKRAEKYPLGAGGKGEWRDLLALLDAGFPRNRGDFDALFRLLSLTAADGSWQLGLQPRSAFARQMIREIRLGLALNDFSLTSNELIFVDGSSMKNEYKNAVLNPALDEKIFHWQPEPDFKVTEPLKK